MLVLVQKDLSKRIYPCLFVFLIFCLPLRGLISPGDTEWPENYPYWWYDASDPENGLIDATQSTAEPHDHALLNQGQLWNIALHGVKELDEQLAPFGGAGFSLDDFRDSTKAPSYYAPALLGQLKQVSSRFFDRFAELGFGYGSTGWPSTLILDTATGYPWSTNQTPSNLAPANLGQAKHLFSWSLRNWSQEIIAMDEDGDALPDYWEVFHFGDLALTGEDDPDLDGMQNALEYTEHCNPNNSDTDGDQMEDMFEKYYHLQPASASLFSFGPGGDLDSDGMTNLEEFQMGSIPTSANENPSISYDDELCLNWFGVSEKTYLIEYKTSLFADQWSSANTYYVGANEAFMIPVDSILPSPSSMAFFRLQMESGPDYSDADANGLPDWWEQFQPDALTVYPLVFETTLTDEEVETLPIYLKAPADSDAEFTIMLSNNELAGQYIYNVELILPGGATNNWMEISQTGTRLNEISDNDIYFEKLALSNFSFPFYENTYDEVYICRDGFVCFNDPSASDDNIYNYIAAFWDELDPAQSGSIYYKEAADHLIIQYQSVAPYNMTGEDDAFTFQMVLHANGGIELFYKEMIGGSPYSLIGIENADGTDYIELFHGYQSPLEQGLAYRISRDPIKFVEVALLSGIVPAGTIGQSALTFNAHNLPSGTYVAEVEITQAGSDENPFTLTATLHVTHLKLSFPNSGQIFWSGQSVSIWAYLTDHWENTEHIEFYSGDTRIGTATDLHYGYHADFVWEDPPIGNHTLTARAIDTEGDAIESASIEITVLEDTDNDRLDDEWEVFYFGSLEAAASADFDGDGIPNIFEYRHGTDPTDSLSQLAFSEIQTTDPKYFLVDAALLTETAVKKKTLSAALSSANDYDIIEVRPGTYNEFLGTVFDRLYVFGAEGARSTIIDASGLNNRCLTLCSESVFSGLTFRGANLESSYHNGGALHLYVNSNENKPRFIGCRFIDNTVSAGGGAICVERGDPTFVSCTIAGNKSTSGNAIFNASDENQIRLVNTLLWNPGTSTEISGALTPIVFDHSLTRDDSTGNVLIDGLDQGTDNPGLAFEYSLLATSVARDAGTLSLYADQDLDRETLADGIKDIGADEFTDSDNDSLPDWLEDRAGTDLTAHADYDSDFLTNLEDYNSGANPLSNDTDGDGILDGDERFDDGTHGDNDGYKTSVNDSDTDGDLLPDGWEVNYGFNPTQANTPEADSDGDGLTDRQEASLGANPLVSDTDEDGMPDLFEFNHGLNLTGDDTNLDADNDGLSNLLEYQLGTNPSYFDTDGDLLPDGWEYISGLDPLSVDNADSDPDNDGIDNFSEYRNNTHPNHPDTDGDGVEDSTEINQGSNPNDPDDGGIAPPADQTETIEFTVGDPSGSHSERWEMIITGLGPDTRVQLLANRAFGTVTEATPILLWKNTSYRIELRHLGTNHSFGADYDWRATVNGRTGTLFTAGSWVVDDPDGLLAYQRHGDQTNLTVGISALMHAVDLEVVKRNDPSKTWADSEPYNSSDLIYAGQSNGDMVRWSIGSESLTDTTFNWLAEHPDGTAIVGPSGVGKYEWIMADQNPSYAQNEWVDWKPGTWTIKCYLNDSLVEFEQEIGVRTEEYFAFGRVTADVIPPETDVSADVINDWSCNVIVTASVAAAAGGINNTTSTYFVPFEWEDRMFVNHQLLNTTSNLPPPIDENLEPEDAFGLDKLQHYRFFIYGQFKFLAKGSEFAATPEAINTVALVGGTPIPCTSNRDTGPLGQAHSDHGAYRLIDGNNSEFEFIGKVRAGAGGVNGNANTNGRVLPWAFLRLRFNPDDGLIDIKTANHSTDPDGPDNLDFSGVPNIVIMRRYYDLNAGHYRVELVENLEESQSKREDFFLSGPPISGKPYLLQR